MFEKILYRNAIYSQKPPLVVNVSKGYNPDDVFVWLSKEPETTRPDRYLNRLTRPKTHFGYLEVDFWGKKIFRVNGAYVDSEYRDKGYGTKMYLACLQAIKPFWLAPDFIRGNSNIAKKLWKRLAKMSNVECKKINLKYTKEIKGIGKKAEGQVLICRLK